MLTRIKDGIDRKAQVITKEFNAIDDIIVETSPDFVACVIAASTGGPPTLIELFKDIPDNANVAFYIVQHGPPWMLETLSQRLQRETKLKVHLATDGMKTEPGNIYIAPGDYHMKINADYSITLDNSPKENFVRPAADPLFHSAAKVFGKYLFAVVLTGLGRDATNGSASVASAKGSVYVQDPNTTVAPSMAKTVIESGIKHQVIALSDLGKTMSKKFVSAVKKLQNERNKS
jgi:two-component system chemotaxis response regulator CheB